MPGLAREIPRREQVIEDLIAYLKAMSVAKRGPPPARMTGLNRCLARPLSRRMRTKGSAEQILAGRVAGKIRMIIRRATKVVAETTMPRSATPWLPKA
jgi:hypothetical protein